MRQIRITESITSRDSESIAAFLREISRYEVPSMEEEVSLAQRIHKGDKLALEELVSRNLRFVISVAKQSQGFGVALEDLIAEGCIGLINAAERFDETRGFRFCSYAVWWIRQSVLKAVANYSNMMHIPSSLRNMQYRLNAARNRFEAEFSREPTPEELSALSGVDPDKLPAFDTIGKVYATLDSPIGDDDSGCLVDFVSDPDIDTDAIMDQESLKPDLHDVINRLPERERVVLKMTFGIEGMEVCSPEEISEALGLSRERVRQIRENALKRIRNNFSSIAVLKKYCA